MAGSPVFEREVLSALGTLGSLFPHFSVTVGAEYCRLFLIIIAVVTLVVPRLRLVVPGFFGVVGHWLATKTGIVILI
jgi:hypothetical protein